jgi:hypothetical protein
MVGGVVGGMFGGPIGSQIGSQVGAGLGGMLENLIGQHGQSGVQSAMNNNMMGALTSQLSQAIQSHPGIPQFARDEMCQALNDVQQGCPAEPTPPGCQEDTDNSMSGIIDKIVDKVVDQIMEKLAGGGCEGGSIQDMIRQAVEDVVREQIGGGAADGGSCPANGGTSPSGSASESEESSCNDGVDRHESLMDDDDESRKAKGGGNWLVALAQAMSKISGQHLKNMLQAQADMADNMTDSSKDKDIDTTEQQEKADKFNEAQGRFRLNQRCSLWSLKQLQQL